MPRQVAGVLLLAASVVTASEQPRPDARAKPLAVGSDKQLLIDDLYFDTSENITLKVHSPRKTGEQNLKRDRPWESVTLNWFSVMEDAGTLRMWYECYDADGWFTGDDTAFCYAESDDGIRWRKPNLGLFDYKGSRENNILFRLIGPKNGHSRVHGTGVFKDPTAPPEARYKAVSQGLWSAFKRPHRITGMHSADGLRWTRYDEPICPVFADSQYSAFWDASSNQYVLYGRVGGRGRSLGRSASRDFRRFDKLKLVLQTDERDPESSDLYNCAVMKYPYAANVYLMFPSLFQHKPQTLDIRLAVSRDGVHWTRPERVPFIPLGAKGAFDSGSLYMGQGLVRRGDELWQYFGGSAMRHDEVEFDRRNEPGFSRVYSRVISRMDGFVSADAGEAGGSFVTPPLIFAGDALILNAHVRPGGGLRVGLSNETGEPVDGRSTRDCVPMTGDHVRAVVHWKTGSDLSSLKGKPTKMRIEMTTASLYAF